MADQFVQVISLKIWVQNIFAYGKKLYSMTLLAAIQQFCATCACVCGMYGCE